MTTFPLISVVMAVYNGAASLPATLDSILIQEGVDLEFIVVNDGSTDDTARILQEYSQKDARLRVIEQENLGLTRSLIRGCAEAKGEFIARQDAGDISMPARLLLQVNVFLNNPRAVMVAGGTQFVGPDFEYLYSSCPSQEEAEAGLQQLNGYDLRGPSHHGCVMFRRASYQTVGGYRRQFRVAQDLDLWTRLVEVGRYLVIFEVLYQAMLVPGAVSSYARKQQVCAASLIAECRQRRQDGRSEEDILIQVEKLTSSVISFSAGSDLSDFYYFVASCLRKQGNVLAGKYYLKVINENPLHLKSYIRLLFRI